MVRAPSLFGVTLSLALVAVFVTTAAQAQQQGRGRGMSRSSFLGLLNREQVQAEMKLTDEQKTQVKAITEKLMGEMREQFSALRDIEDRAKRAEKMSELSDQLDGKLREEMRGLLEREQMMRLFQIRLQVNAASDSLTNERLARRLEISDQQKQKLAEVKTELQAKQAELYGKMSDASQNQRSSLNQELRQLRADADQKALDALTAEQKKSFEEMKGKIIELRRPNRNQSN